MEVLRVQNNYINKSLNNSRKQTVSNVQSISFQGGKQNFVPID